MIQKENEETCSKKQVGNHFEHDFLHFSASNTVYVLILHSHESTQKPLETEGLGSPQILLSHSDQNVPSLTHIFTLQNLLPCSISTSSRRPRQVSQNHPLAFPVSQFRLNRFSRTDPGMAGKFEIFLSARRADV